MGFTHQYADQAYTRFTVDHSGKLLPNKLQVYANISLKSGSPNYDETKVNSLVLAAGEYARLRNYDGVDFWSAD